MHGYNYPLRFSNDRNVNFSKPNTIRTIFHPNQNPDIKKITFAAGIYNYIWAQGKFMHN